MATNNILTIGSRAGRWVLPAVLTVMVVGATLLPSGCGSSNSDPPPQSPTPQTQTRFNQTNLVSDVPGLAAVTDARLVNPWGLAITPTGILWAADNGTGVTTIYTPDGNPIGGAITVGPSGSTPTGVVFNGTASFLFTNGTTTGPAQFIFATEDGTIAAWNPNVDATHALVVADRSSEGAVYKGLATASTPTGNFLFATNFFAGAVDVFTTDFVFVRSFTDPDIPTGFAPFGIANIGGNLWVTFAKQQPSKQDDQAGPGNGFVDIFAADGRLLRRFASQGVLNSPWGIAMAPRTFGNLANTVFIGNFGDGRIHAFDPFTGSLVDELQKPDDTPIVIDGLWSLVFGNGANGASTDTLFFTAGPNDETHGLLGTLRPAP